MRTDRESGTAQVPLDISPDTAALHPGYVLRRFAFPVSERQQRVDCGHLSKPAQPDRTAMPQRLRPAVTDSVLLMFSRRQVEIGDLAEPLALWATGHG